MSNLFPSLVLPLVQSNDAAQLAAKATQNAIFKSPNISCIVFDAKGEIHGFNVGAQRLLGYSAAHLTCQLNLTDICDTLELVTRAMAQGKEFGVSNVPSFEGVFELNCIRLDGHRLPVTASVDALDMDGCGQVTAYLLLLTDNTVCKRLQVLHNVSTSSLQKFTSRLPGIVYRFRLYPDGSSCFPYASDALQDVYRISPEDVREDATVLFKKIHPDDYEGLIASIQKSAIDLTPWQHEFRVKFDGGQIRWQFGNALPEREADGATLWHGFVTDITKQKGTENSLRLSENRIRATLDAIPDLMFELDLDGRYHDFHSPRTDLLVAPAQDMMGQLMSDTLSIDAAQIVMAAIQDAHENGYSSGQQFVLKLEQGERWFELSISRKTTEPGESPRFIVLSRDITERHKVKEKLRISDLALKSISQGVLIAGPDGLLLSANDAFLTITGYSEAEIMGRTCSFLQGVGTDSAVIAAMKLAQLQATEFNGVILNYRKDGCAFWNELSITPMFDANGQVSHFIGITRDITERVQAESIAKSERFIRTVTDAMPGLVAYWDHDLSCRFANQAYLEWFGKTPDEVIGGTLMNLLGEPLFALNEPYIRAALAGDRQQFERTLTKADGSTGYTLAHYIPDLDGDGLVAGFYVLVTDVTPLKQAHAELQLASVVYQNTSEAIMVTDANGIILSVNPAFTDITGYPAQEAIGKSTRLLTSNQHEPEFYAELWRQINETGQWQGEIWNRRKNGEIFLEWQTITRISGLDSEAVRYVSVFHDITESSKQKEMYKEQLEVRVIERTAALVAAEAEQRRLNRALRLVSDCNLAVVHAHNENQLLTELCRLVVETGGYLMAWVGVAEQDSAKTVRPLASFGHAINYLESVQVSWDSEQAIGSGPTGMAICTGRSQVSQNCWTNAQMAPWRAQVLNRGYQSIAALPLVVDGVVRCILTLFSTEPEAFGTHEMTLLESLAGDMAFGLMSLQARAQLTVNQQQLETLVSQRTQEIYSLNTALTAKAHDAEKASLAKGAFLASMSHELRTPLNAVIGFAGLLIDSPLGRRQHDYADKIQLSAQALRALIDDILDFSKIEAGELRLEQAPFSLCAILRTTASVVGVGLGSKPVEAVFEVGSEVPDALIGDTLRLQQILLNLTSNAVKFTSTGSIVVAVRCLTGAQGSEGSPVTLQFTVRDTGIGIAPEKLGSIFNGFTQADASTSRQYGGSGLGLAISERLATLMQGQISVKSVVGWGSEFRFAVPLTLGHHVESNAAADIPSNLRILIVDDHAMVRDMLTHSCVAFGWQVTAVDSAAAALNEFQRSNAAADDYDLLLLDWRMPGMDGLEMLRQAYATPGLGLPQVLLMASMVELEHAVLASDGLHLDGIVAKPLTPGSLQDALIRMYAGEHASLLPMVQKNNHRLAGKRLLVAEDNVLNQEVIEQMLTRAGAKVVLVNTGGEAVAVLRMDSESFDAVLMDIQMPLMDGYSATRIIREELGLLDLPIIAVTAFAQPEDREKSRLAGMVGHVVKPLDVDELMLLLNREKPDAMSPLTEIQNYPAQATPSETPLAVLDVSAAMKIFGGDEQRYGNILRKFVVQHGGDVDEALRLFQMDDTPGAVHLLHELKGVAGFLQAKELARWASAGEDALRSGQTVVVPDLFESLQAAMQRLQECIQNLENSHAQV